MEFKLVSSKIDPVKIWSNENGTLKIYKRRNTGYIVKRISLFDILGETLGEYSTLEEAIKEA